MNRGLPNRPRLKTVFAAARKLYNTPEVYGFAITAKIDEGFMTQTLKLIILFNGVNPLKKTIASNLNAKRRSVTSSDAGLWLFKKASFFIL